MAEIKEPKSEKAQATFATIEEAIEEIRRGRMVVVCDDENRENEGDLTLAAQFATPEAINFMATHGRGLICLSLTGERCAELGLDLMAAKNESPFETAFTISVEAREGVTTGISAHDRARTIQVAIDPHSGATDLVQPGHVFPLKAKDGGVLRADRPDRGRRGPGPPSRPEPRRRHLRDHERGRDDGPGPRPGALLREARAEDGHGRGPDRLPPPHRAPGRAHRRHQAADQVRRVQRRRLSLPGGRQAPRGDGQGRGLRSRGRAGAGPLGVPHRRRLPLAALRLRQSSSRRRWRRSSRRGGACCSTSPRRAAASAC